MVSRFPFNVDIHFATEYMGAFVKKKVSVNKLQILTLPFLSSPVEIRCLVD